MERLWELLCCYLLALGTGLLLNMQFPYPATWPAVLWQTLLPVLVMALLTMRRWILPTVLAGAVTFVLIYLLLSKQLRPALSAAWGFIRWWLKDLPQDSEWFTPAHMTIVHALVHVFVGVGAFLLVRLTHRAWPMALACVILLLIVTALGDTSCNVAAVGLYLAGLFPLVARDHYGGRRWFSREEIFTPLGRRGVLPALACCLCLVTVGVVIFLLPANTENIRTRFCSDVMADVQSLTGIFSTNQRSVDAVSLHDLGLQPNAYRLGGDLRPVKEPQVVAVTDGAKPMLLRVTTFDQFTGNRWKHTFDTAYRFDGYASGKRKLELSGAAEENKLPNFFRIEDTTIALGQETHFLLTVGQTRGLSEYTSTKNPVLFNRNGELFSFFRMPWGYQYTLHTTRLDLPILFNNADFRAVQAVIDAEDAPSYDEKVLDRCLQLPGVPSAAAKEEALKLQKQHPESFRLAAEICRYFTSHIRFSYDEHPGKLSKDDNVVDQLMRTGKGYCVHYASTMAVMTRTVGIPTRLAAGYQTAPDEQGNYVATTATPYAWVECYFPHLGWVAFDPTPVRIETDKQQKPVTPPPPQEPEPITQPEHTDPDDGTPEDSDADQAWPLWSVLTAALLLLISLGIWRFLASRKFYDPEAVAKRFPSAARQTEYYYRDVLRQMALLGFRPARHETLAEFTARITAADAPTGAWLAQVRIPVESLHYGGCVTAQQAAAVAAAHGQIEAAVYRRLPRPLYPIVRRLLLPYFAPAVYRYPASSVQEDIP